MIYNLHFDGRIKLLGKFFSLPVKIQGDSYSFDIVDPNMKIIFPYHPPMLRRRDSIQKLHFTISFNYNILCQILNNVSRYVDITAKNSSLNTHFAIFCLLYSPVGVCHIRFQQESPNIFGLHFPLYIFSIWTMSWWKLSPRSSKKAPRF